MLRSIVLESQNPRDLSLAELEELSKALQEDLSSVTVELVAKPHKAGTYAVTLQEVLIVWIPAALAYAPVVQTFAKWARQRFRKNSRPKSLSVYDDEGNAIGTFLIKSPDGDLEERLATKRAEKRLPPRDKSNGSDGSENRDSPDASGA